MPDSEWLTIIEACQFLNVSKRTLYTYMESGHLPYYQLGDHGHRRIRAEDLDNLMVASGPAGKRPLCSVETGFDMDDLKELGRYLVELTIRQLHGAPDAGDPTSISESSLVADAHPYPKEAVVAPEKKIDQRGWFPFEFDVPLLRSKK